MTITAWRLDQPAPTSAPRAPLTEPARVHGWRPCTNGCGTGFRCPSCGHYRHDATPAAGYRCRRCIDTATATKHLSAYLAAAISTGVGVPEPTEAAV